MRAIRYVIPFLVLILAAGPAVASRPHAPERLAPGKEDQLKQLRRVSQDTMDADFNEAWSRSNPAFRSFLRQVGGQWMVRVDRNTGTPALIWGSGIPWHPGVGNELTWESLGGEPTSPAEWAKWLETRARSFLASHPGLFQVPAGVELRRNDRITGSVRDGHVRFLSFDVYQDDVLVHDASVVFRLNAGNLVQFGSARVSDALTGVTVKPAVSAEEAMEAALQSLVEVFTPAGQPPAEVILSEVRDAGTLMLLPFAAPSGIDYRLVWRVSFRVEGGYETWVSHRDALTGAELSLHDSNRYACPQPATPQGRVTGGVFLGPIEEVPESIRPMPFAAVDNNGALTADFNGIFPLDTSQPASTGLNGRFFNMFCEGCNNPAQVFMQQTGSGDLFLGFGGADQNGNGISTSSERNVFYASNVVRHLATKHLDDATVNGFFSVNFDANVNIPAQCNAFYDGVSINFFRSGGGCNNSGDIHDVVHHEWGHGIDDNTSGGGFYDGARGESIGDICGMLSTHDPRNAPYFFVGQPYEVERHHDENEPFIPTKTFSNITGFCPGGGGPAGAQIHCESGVLSQAFWHLKNLLVANYGDPAGWYVSERLFFQSLPVTNTYEPGQVDSTFDGYILVDDDNGNLADGTPNGNEIFDAFDHHEIASGPVGDSPDCPPPPGPVLTLQLLRNMNTNLPQVSVSWTNVPAAQEYVVYRNDAGGWGPDLEVARLTAPNTSFLDDNVTDGVTYRYRVLSFDASDCFSVSDNLDTILVSPAARMSLDAWTADDSGPVANGNGVPEPGETVDLPIDVEALVGPATAITVTLTTTHPGVTIINDTTTIPDLMTAQVAGSIAAHFQISIDATVPCAELIPFEVDIEAAEGCSEDSFVLEAGVSGFTDLATDEMETGVGWVIDPDGTDDATDGFWVLEDPMADRGSPEDDHTPAPGAFCWITGNNGVPGQGGADDVDDGCTTIQSPVYAMGGVSGLQLTYWRFVNVARLDANDGLFVEISNDGGGNWQPLEAVRADTIGFEQAVFDLDTELGGPAQDVMLRFQACDFPGGSFMEAYVDDIAISEPFTNCDPISAGPPQLDMTTFAVGDDALAGGFGNGNGTVDPGETVKVPVDLVNLGTGGAFNVRGTVAITSAPPAVVLSDGATAWIDIAASATETSGTDAPPHVELQLPRPGVDCGGEIVLELTVDYEDSSGTPYVLIEEIRLPIGCTGATGCESMPTPPDAGPVVRALSGDEDGVEFTWPLATPTPGEHFRLYRGVIPTDVTLLVSPPGHAAVSYDDRTAPDALYFYQLRLADCDGVEGP